MKILKSEQIFITRKEANFDRACDEAYTMAAHLLGMTENGHSTIKGWDRSSCSIRVKFVRYEHTGSMVGHTYTYVFLGEAVKG